MSIFQLALENALDEDEMIVADAGYNCDSCIQLRDAVGDEKQVVREFRARHEIVNTRLKKFNVLANKFRHDLSSHSYCFFAVSNITKVLIEKEELMFDIDY